MNGQDRNPNIVPSAAFFAPLVGTEFTVDTLAGPMPLQLVSCTELPRGARPAALRTPLSLIFSGPPRPRLEQDNYYVDHPAMPRQVWCIAPTAPFPPASDQEGALQPARCRYQVMFG